MKIRVNKVHYPVTALGPGRRLGIWVQGCTLACPGCLSRDTWEPLDATEVEVDDLLEILREMCPEGPDGVTISGGEPFEQVDAVRDLVAGIRSWGEDLGRRIDVLCYSGLPYGELRDQYRDLLEQLDALVPEPFRADLEGGGPLRGSINQPLVLLSNLARERFGPEWLDGRAARMQVHVDDEAIWMIGVPRRGDLRRLESRLAERGIKLGQVSWRP